MKNLKLNFKIAIITLLIYTINQLTKKHITIHIIKWFMNCYFNDFIGGITFMAYVNYIAILNNKHLIKLWQIELLLFFCGLIWEYITPIFRTNTVCDNFDIIAYMLGGYVYWILITKFYKNK